jgi:hypothetical protein
MFPLTRPALVHALAQGLQRPLFDGDPPSPGLRLAISDTSMTIKPDSPAFKIK